MNKDISFTAGAVKEALSIIRETAQRLKDEGRELWQPENLTVENIGCSPQEYVLMKKGGEDAAAFVLNFEDNLYWSEIPKNTTGFIHKICIREKFLKTGLVEKIVDYCKEICRKKGLKYLRLDTDADREPLVNLYKRLGFKLIAVKDFRETKCCDVTKIALFEMEI